MMSAYRNTTLISTLFLALLAMGCGSDDNSPPAGDSGGKDQQIADAGVDQQAADVSVDQQIADSAADQAVGDSGTSGCGCAAGEICVYPCCGGAPPQCLDKQKDGSCPPGTSPGCEFTGNPDGCQMDPCTPDPPYCAKQAPVGCSDNGKGEAYCACP